jgi:tRNA (mo5U34)-methyltransferase
VRLEQIERHPGFPQPWYYVIELAPGVFTRGKDRPNVALTRRLLQNVEIGPGVRCLDVGIQEGLVSILLERRGADVVAYDRIFSEERLALVQDALETRFELIGAPVRTAGRRVRRPEPGVGMPLARLPRELSERGHRPFDVVVFSGVLYHVYDPLAALASVRGLVRNGGIVVIETAATFDADQSIHLNSASRFTRMSIWQPSLGCLDYMLRLVRLKPLDLAYFGKGRRRGRVAVACRAVDAPPADPGDEWIGSDLHDYELAEYLDWESLSSDRPPIRYRGVDGERIGLVESLRDRRPHRPADHETRLALGTEF